MNTVIRILALAAALLAVPLLTTAPAAASEPIPAYAQHRLDRVAAALAKDPLFIDPDMVSALDETGRARVRAAMKSAAGGGGGGRGGRSAPRGGCGWRTLRLLRLRA